MAYNEILDTQLDPDAPITSSLGYQLRDNPEAVWEGLSGAPRIDPINAMAHQGVAGAVGTYVFAFYDDESAVPFGATVAGSGLFPAGVRLDYLGNSLPFDLGTALSGTWRCMGRKLTTPGPTEIDVVATLWLRIA